MCLIYDGDVETVNHLFFLCDITSSIMFRIGRCWNIYIPVMALFEDWLAWFSSFRLYESKKVYLEVVFWLCCGRFGAIGTTFYLGEKSGDWWIFLIGLLLNRSFGLIIEVEERFPWIGLGGYKILESLLLNFFFMIL